MDAFLTWQNIHISTKELKLCLAGSIKPLPMKVKDKTGIFIFTMIINMVLEVVANATQVKK